MSLIVRGYDPFKEMDDMFSHMNKVMSSALAGRDNSFAAVPLADIFEEDGKYVVHAHLGGLTEKEVDVHVENGALVISGERKVSDEEKKKRSYMIRESSTNIYRRIGLPKNADASKIEAKLEDGILRIEVPKSKELEPKKIPVKVSKK